MSASQVKIDNLKQIFRGESNGGPVKVIIELLTGSDNHATKIPDVDVKVFIFGVQVFHHIFRL